jgi:XTP/dITP diphosphohydrolase
MGNALLLATKNPKKVREMSEILADVRGIHVCSAADFPGIAEPEETGLTFEENASQKALYYAKMTGMLALADDSGLVVDALDGRPGVFSSRYGSCDAERIKRLLSEMQNIPAVDRSARFKCFMVLAQGAYVLASAEGTLEGTIMREQRGTHGFGYDPVFYVPELGCHLAEAEAETKNRISHRGRALQNIMPAVLQAFK